MIHASFRYFVVSALSVSAVFAAAPALALDLEGLDDVTMRVIDANEKPAKFVPQIIALPKPSAPTTLTTVTNGATTPAKSGVQTIGPTAIGAAKAK